MIRTSSSAQSCEIVRLTCKTVAEQYTLAAFRGAASAGKDESFIKIFPWETLCDLNPHLIHYVSYTLTKKAPYFMVCGWMTVKHMPEWKGYYIVEITTRPGNGVGYSLHHELTKDLSSDHFVYLYPLDNAAANAYTRWGYRPLDSKLAYMFYGNPPRAFIAGLHKALDDHKNMNTEAYTMKLIAKLRTMLPHELLEAFDHRISTDPSFVDIIHDIEELTYGEKKGTLKGFLNGGRKRLNVFQKPLCATVSTSRKASTPRVKPLKPSKPKLT